MSFVTREELNSSDMFVNKNRSENRNLGIKLRCENAPIGGNPGVSKEIISCINGSQQFCINKLIDGAHSSFISIRVDIISYIIYVINASPKERVSM